MNNLIKYPLAASFALAVLAGAAYLLLGRSAGIAFADVRQQIEQAQTMTVTVTTEMTTRNGLRLVTMKMFVKSPGLMRQERLMEEPATGPASSQSATGPVMPKTISIIDMNNQKGITLIPEKKQAVTLEFKNVPPETMVKMKRQNFLEELKKAVAGEHEELGEKKIGGQLAKGYRCKSPEMNQVTMDVWVDAANGKPLLVEQTMPEEMGMGKIKVTMTDLVLNPRLDDAIFDTNVPEGYSTLMNQSFDFNVQEEDLIKWLGTLAEAHGGVFPKGLFERSQKTPSNAKPPTSQPRPQTSEEAVMKETMAKMQPMQKALAFQMRTMQGGEFVYAGEGVKLGDKATPILWCKAKDAKTYRVIYADLHAEDAEQAPKQSSRQPATEPR